MSKQTSMKEIEIKLYANNDVLVSLRDSILFKKYCKQDWQTKELLNQYIDTEDHALAKAKVALRVRKDGGQFIQTLKAKGSSTGGLSERDEFDWIINNPQLDLSLLDERHWPKSLAGLDKSKLLPIFSTDFTRDCILIEWQQAKKSAQVEVALDRGLIKTKTKQKVISELELELKQGSVDALLDFALMLAHQFPLIPSDTSKAERGYRLLNFDSYQFKLSEKPSNNDEIKLLKYQLAMTQGLLESCLWLPSYAGVMRWISQLEQLATFLQRIADKELQDLLMPILQEWRENISINDELSLIDELKREVNLTRWGVFSLSVSRWLLNRV